MKTLEEAHKIITEFGAYLEKLEYEPSLLTRASQSPYTPWKVRWAILTCLWMAQNNPQFVMPVYMALKMAWSELERFSSDAEYNRIQAAIKATEGSTERAWLESTETKIVENQLIALSNFDSIAMQIAGSSFVEHALSVTRTQRQAND